MAETGLTYTLLFFEIKNTTLLTVYEFKKTKNILGGGSFANRLKLDF